MMIRGYLNHRSVKWLLIVGLLAAVVILTAWACSPTTITLPPETITITPPPETVTITPPPETITITLTPTPTLTPPPPYAGLENPFPWDDTSAQQVGKVIFLESCAVCHVATETVPALGIDFYAVDYRQSLEERPDFYFWTVSEGRLDTVMPPWGSSLSEEERWQVLTYIWSLEGTTPTPSTFEVHLSGIAFVPEVITVPVGVTVTWTNMEAVTHTVTSDTGLFHSGDLSVGDTFSYTFTEGGTFNYYCTIHPSFYMTGTVVVE